MWLRSKCSTEPSGVCWRGQADGRGLLYFLSRQDSEFLASRDEGDDGKHLLKIAAHRLGCFRVHCALNDEIKIAVQKSLGRNIEIRNERDAGTLDAVETNIAGRWTERSEARFYSAAIYLAPDSIPAGAVQVAIDDAAGEAFGIVSVNDQTSAPTWTKLGDTVGIFVNAISFGGDEGIQPYKP